MSLVTYVRRAWLYASSGRPIAMSAGWAWLEPGSCTGLPGLACPWGERLHRHISCLRPISLEWAVEVVFMSGRAPGSEHDHEDEQQYQNKDEDCNEAAAPSICSTRQPGVP